LDDPNWWIFTIATGLGSWDIPRNGIVSRSFKVFGKSGSKREAAPEISAGSDAASCVLLRHTGDSHSPTQPDPDAAWQALAPVSLDARHLDRERVISAGRTEPAHMAFDVLRTRLLLALGARGWRRVAITSPTQGCGKTFVAANLALSLARRRSCRTVLMDMDLRLSRVAGVLGIRQPGSMHAFLTGQRTPAEHLLRVGDNLAVGLNDAPVADAAELMQEPRAHAALDAMQVALEPDVVLFDLPPILCCDDAIAFFPQVDGVLLVAGGGITRTEEIRHCERLLGDRHPLLGVILNRAEDASVRPYAQ
jgi:Mrp family chromosome partitioning ATPase